MRDLKSNDRLKVHWNRRMVLGGAVVSAGSLLFGGCARSDKVTSDNRHRWSDVPPSTIWVKVSDTSIGTIFPGFTGLSYDKDSMAVPRFTPDNNNLIGLFRRLGAGLLRIGGNTADRMHWAPHGAGRTAGEVAPSDVDALAGFLKATAWNCLYGVNLATSTPAAAAAEVSYAMNALGSSLYAVEIGNECDLYGHVEQHLKKDWNLGQFERLWEQFRSEIVRANPTVVIAGPGSASNISTWTIPFARDVGNGRLALLTQHYYRGDGHSADSTREELISPDSMLIEELSQLNIAAKRVGIPLRITETNSFYHDGAPGVSNSYASALWIIDHLFRIALGGAVGANVHSGDVDPYTPIADHGGVVAEVRPEYYGIFFFSLAGHGSLLELSISERRRGVSVYAVRAARDDLRIVIVNKDQTQNFQISIDCGQPVLSAHLISMTCLGLERTHGVTIDGAAIGLDGAFSPSPASALPISRNWVTCYVNALNCVMISAAIAT